MHAQCPSYMQLWPFTLLDWFNEYRVYKITKLVMELTVYVTINMADLFWQARLGWGLRYYFLPVSDCSRDWSSALSSGGQKSQ